jgi:hypothetical protein
MRRLAIFCLPLIALVAPAAALAFGDAKTADGTLVVQNASAPRSVIVVTLVVDGTALGHVSTGSPDQLDKVVIQDFNVPSGDIGASITNNAPALTRTSLSDNKTSFVGSDFRFRAANGTYKIWIYGTGVNVFAVGRGTVVLQGQSDPSVPDGKYSRDGGDWRSLPAVPSDLLHFGSNG